MWDCYPGLQTPFPCYLQFRMQTKDVFLLEINTYFFLKLFQNDIDRNIFDPSIQII
jgi:hypothetical protein